MDLSGEMNMEAEKRTTIALFDGFTFMQAVPDGCPDEYAKTDFSNRRAFARWLEQHGKEFLYDGTEKISPYPYYIYYKGNGVIITMAMKLLLSVIRRHN